MVMALLFGYTGAVEASAGMGWIEEQPYIPADLFGGLALIIIAATYLYSLPELLAGKAEGMSYVIGGTLLALVFGGLYASLIATTWFGENIVAPLEPVEEEEPLEEAAVADAEGIGEKKRGRKTPPGPPWMTHGQNWPSPSSRSPASYPSQTKTR